MRLKLKNPYRHIEGESENDRIRRGHEETSLQIRYKRLVNKSNGSSRNSFADVMVALDFAAKQSAEMDLSDVDWQKLARLARAVTREADKLKFKAQLPPVEKTLLKMGSAEKVTVTRSRRWT